MTDPPASPAGSEARVLWRRDPATLKSHRAERPGEILRLLSRARRDIVLYGAEHTVIQKIIDDLQQFLQSLLTTRPSVKLLINEDTFFIDNTVLLEESLQLDSLLKAFKDRQIFAVQVNDGVEGWELRHFIEVLNLKDEQLGRPGATQAYLDERGLKKIKIASAAVVGTKAAFAGMVVDPQDVYQAGLRVMDELTYQAGMNLPLNVGKALKVVNYLLDVAAGDPTAVFELTTLKDYDEDTYHHSVRVSMLSLMIGSQLNLDREVLVTLGLAGLLHDIGKVQVDRNVLTKPARLTPEEEELVRRHTVHGAHALRELSGILRLAIVVAFEHHANYNLSGYPRITAKEVPHLLTRIVTVADVFDAVTSSRRAYRRSRRPEEALQAILDGAGTEFDPVVAKLSVKVLAGLFRDLRRRTAEAQTQSQGAQSPNAQAQGTQPPAAQPPDPPSPH
jgi:putative nucleotidyltransferase with HDIG domain